MPSKCMEKADPPGADGASPYISEPIKEQLFLLVYSDFIEENLDVLPQKTTEGLHPYLAYNEFLMRSQI